MDPVEQLLHLDDQLSAEEKAISETVRKFVQQDVLPSIENNFRDEVFPQSLPQKLGELGLLGSFLPESLGGSNLSYTAYGIICRELEQGDSGVRSFCSVQSSLVMLPIWKFGSQEQQSKYLSDLSRGALIGCFGLTEPDSGSNPSRMITKAKKTAQGYKISGTKRWITNANVADICIVWAKEDDDTISGFIIPKGTPGLIQKTMHNKMSLRASNTGELIFDDCIVNDDAKLPLAKGLKSAFTCLDSARFGIAWGAIGAAKACFDCALEYTKSRSQFNRPLAGHQLVQAKLVTMLTLISSAQLLALHLGRLRDANRSDPAQTSLGKMQNVRSALECARLARDLLGANGISTEYPIIRHMLNLESVNTYEGTEDIHRLILGRWLTDIEAFNA
jgi:glutaryl-CoA dehydrogenase